MSGELIKLHIKAYSDPNFQTEVANGDFRTLLNPEKYIFKYKVEQARQRVVLPEPLGALRHRPRQGVSREAGLPDPRGGLPVLGGRAE